MKKMLGVLVILIAAIFMSCQNDKVVEPGQELGEKSTEIVQDEVTVENIESEVNYEVSFYANAERTIVRMLRNGEGWKWRAFLRYSYRQCPDVTIDSTETGYPKTITLDYGDGVELKNGRVLSGIVTITLSAPPLTDGSTKTVEYLNFSVDSVSVSGTSVFEFTGDNETTRMHTHTGDLYFTMPDGKIIYRELNKIHEWLAGVDTPEDMTDDIIQITGDVNVSVSNGNEYSKEITIPILKTGECRWFVQGVVEISVNGETMIVIDYGDGECDAAATVTKDGVTHEIDLSNKRARVNRGSGK